MPDSQSIPPAVLLGIALYVYALASRHIAKNGGKVRIGEWDLPELLMSLVLAGSFGLLMVMAIERQSKGESEVKIETVLPSSFVFVFLSIGILGFLRFFRKRSLGRLLGIDQSGPLATIGWAVGLILAAFPLTRVANAVTMVFMKEGLTPQPLIELFVKMVREDNYAGVAKIFVAGVIIAPCCEEFLFRGFFYGVWKRYIGPLAAGTLACVLFAAFHTSLPAFGGLLVLAICLNVAYERTGSLLVPIGMHAIFNFTSLFLLYLQARGLPLLETQ